MRLIDADALIEFCAERWIPLNIDAVNMQPTIQPECDWTTFGERLSKREIQPEIIRCKDCKHKHVETWSGLVRLDFRAVRISFADIGQNRIRGNDMEDLISRKSAIEAINGMIDRFERILADIRESKGDDSVCGMCEYDGAYMGQSGDWCNECPGFDKDNCFKLSDRCRKRWMGDIVLPSAQPETCEGCKHLGKWENEVEYGYSSPCTRCKRMVGDNYER